MLTYNPP